MLFILPAQYRGISSFVTRNDILGSLSNDDDDGHKNRQFAYLKTENSIFARFVRAFFTLWHFEDVLVLSTTWKDLSCSCVDDVNIWWQMFSFVFLCPKGCRVPSHSRIVRIHFSSIMTSNNWTMIAETRSYIFKWRSRFRRRRVCLSSLLNSLWHFMNIQTNINRKHFAKLQVVGQQSTANCRLSIYGHCSYWIFDECRIIYLFEQKSSWLNHFYGPRRILWLVRLPCQQYRFQTGLFDRLDIGIGWILGGGSGIMNND